jgi:hypothetical protein
MMRRLALTALGVLLFAGASRSQNPPARPEGSPPTQREAVFKDGFLLSKLVVTVFVNEKRVRKVTDPDGKVKDVEYIVTVPVNKTVEEKIDPKKATIARADGKAVPIEELAKVLEKPGIVMVASNFEKVDPFYLQFLAAETLIVVPERPLVAVPIDPKP